MNNKILKGIYKVSLKWNKICLESSIRNDMAFFSYEDFRVLLLQSFDADYRDKILEAIYSDKTLIIDFDAEEVNIVVDKGVKYLDSMRKIFSASYIEEKEMEDSFTTIPFDYYKVN